MVSAGVSRCWNADCHLGLRCLAGRQQQGLKCLLSTLRCSAGYWLCLQAMFKVCFIQSGLQDMLTDLQNSHAVAQLLIPSSRQSG